ncbi:MAG: Rieske 2Fe-2S domain-containing protein [Chloroflexi bacterium]|nr:Rieske 2Fe-2S domain-containing protein [Chloroflexota bacterium]
MVDAAHVKDVRLTAEENETITRVGPGTPMGELMRRYWLPVLSSAELPEPDCAPVRVRILGEDLVAFRDTSGRIGLLTEFCAHRRTSLWLGRNEEDGLRCVFHGWKYDVAGKCVDMPNVLPEYDFKERVTVRAYPTQEMGGVIWAYMGWGVAKGKQPPPPSFEWTRQPASHLHVSRSLQECNWLQALEAGIDSIHTSFLHRRFGGNRPGLAGLRAQATAARLEVRMAPYGYAYASSRPLSEGQGDYVRTYHYVMPFHQIRAIQGETEDSAVRKFKIAGHMWVPVDDENCMVWNWYYSLDLPLDDDERDEGFWGNGPRFVDPQNGFRSFLNKGNDWGIDREVQKHETFSGIEGVNQQDRAVQEAMGPIVDRSHEHLSHTDMAVFAARKLLLDAIKTVADGGAPPGADESYYDIRAIEKLLPTDADWVAELKDQMYPKGGPDLASAPELGRTA